MSLRMESRRDTLARLFGSCSSLGGESEDEGVGKASDVIGAHRKRGCFSPGISRVAECSLFLCGGGMAGFGELGLSSWLVEQCRQLGLKQPTPVQLGCIPAILEGERGGAGAGGRGGSWGSPLPPLMPLRPWPGRDCLGCAKTGSGKTAAFVLPILQKLSEDPYGIFGLVLTPTR